MFILNVGESRKDFFSCECSFNGDCGSVSIFDDLLSVSGCHVVKANSSVASGALFPYMCQSHDDMGIHETSQSPIPLSRRMLIPQGHLNITMSTPIQKLSQCCALLGVHG